PSGPSAQAVSRAVVDAREAATTVMSWVPGGSTSSGSDGPGSGSAADDAVGTGSGSAGAAVGAPAAVGSAAAVARGTTPTAGRRPARAQRGVTGATHVPNEAGGAAP